MKVTVSVTDEKGNVFVGVTKLTLRKAGKKT